MAHKEVKEMIDRLNNNLFQTYQAYFIWKHMHLLNNRKTGEEEIARCNAKSINKYKNFFQQTKNSNLIFFIIRISGLLSEPRSLSIPKIRNFVNSNKKRLTAEAFLKENPDRPHIKELCETYSGITNDRINEIDGIIKKNKEVIKTFKNIRNKRAAHMDIKKIEITIPPFEKIEALFKDIIKIINILSYGLEHNTTDYSQVEEITKRDLNNIIKKLQTT